MDAKETNARLIEKKLELMRKYNSLANQTTSKPKRRQLTHRAEKFRRQVEQLKHA